MATIAQVKRALMARVEGIDALEIAVTAPFVVTLCITAAPDADKNQLYERVRNVLHDIRPAGYHYEITYDNSIILPHGPALEGRFSLATIDVDFRRNGLRRALLKLVPSLARLVVVERSEGPVSERCVRLHVAAKDPSATPKVLSDTRKAISAIGFAGLRYEVVPLSQDDCRNELENCGILVPRRQAQLDRFTEEDEEIFAGRIKRLVAGHSDAVPLIDSFDGSSVLWGVQFQGGLAPLSCFLPLYDRALVMMPPPVKLGDADYFERSFGMSRGDFFLYCERGKIVPIFKFELGSFPDEAVRPILENPALPFVSPRELDYLSARYAWNDFGVIKALRSDPRMTRALFQSLDYMRKKPKGIDDHATKIAEDIISTLLVLAERFEGVMWRQGHLQLANFTPAMLSMRGVHVRTAGDSSSKAFMIRSDVMMSATELALAQSMRASLHPGMILSEPLLALVAAQFRGGPSYVTKREAERLPQVLSALDLAYNDSISPQEYLDVFDQSETRRIRQIVREVLKTGSDESKEQEVRERIHRFNEGVCKLRSKALELADVGVLGYTENGVDTPSGQKEIVTMLGGFLGLGLLHRAGARAFEGVIEDTKAGELLDRVRGVVNRVPAQSVRLYRVRRKLGRIAGRVDVPAGQSTTTSIPIAPANYVVNVTNSTVGSVAVGNHPRAEGEAGTLTPPSSLSDTASKDDGS